MPYALRNLVEGEVPSYRYVGSAAEAAPGEVVLTDADYESKVGWVWDAARGALRAPSGADRLRWAKRRKKEEFAQRMHAEIEALFPEVRSVNGAWVAEALIEVVSDPKGSRVGAIKTNRDKRTAKFGQVDAQDNAAQVDALTWEGA